MQGYNKVILAGNMTRDPQLKYLPNNTAVCEFGLAMNRRWRDKDGNQHEDVCFVDVAAFGRQGEMINQYMAKGRSILVEGRLKLDQWTGQDGTKRSRLTVVAENFTFLGGPREAGGGSEYGGAPAARTNMSSAPNRGYERAENPGRGYSNAPRSAAPAPMAPTDETGAYEGEPPADDRPPGGDDIPF